METKKKLKVSAINNGTVIDRIPAGQLFHVIEILGLAKGDFQMTFGTNLESKVLGLKSIIKISDKFFEDSFDMITADWLKTYGKDIATAFRGVIEL